MIYLRYLTGFDMLSFLTNLSFMEFLVRYLALFCLFLIQDGFQGFWMGRICKNSYVGVPQGYILGPKLFLLYISDLPNDVIWNIAIYTDDNLYCKCNQPPDLWQQLELASELKSEDWGSKWLVDFNAWKTQLISFDWSYFISFE